MLRKKPYIPYFVALTLTIFLGQNQAYASLFSNAKVDHRTELTSMIRKGDLKKVKALILSISNIEEPSPSTPLLTPVQEAVWFGQFEIFNYLAACGADIKSLDKQGRSLLHLLMDQRFDATVSVDTQLKFINHLIGAGLEIDALDRQGHTVLISACANPITDPKVVATLLQYHPDLEARANNGATALICAVRNNNEQVALKLIEAKADLNAADNEGFSPIGHATSLGFIKLVRLLAKAGADINQPGPNSMTPLMTASFTGKVSTLVELIKLGADIHAQTKVNITIKKRSSFSNHPNPFSTGITINKGATALTFAKEVGNVPIIKILEEAGAR